MQMSNPTISQKSLPDAIAEAIWLTTIMFILALITLNGCDANARLKEIERLARDASLRQSAVAPKASQQDSSGRWTFLLDVR